MNESNEKVLRELAERAHPNKKRGSIFEFRGRSALVHELQVHEIELEMQNEQLKEVQHRLAESEAHYTDLFLNAPVAYLIHDKSGTIRDSNFAAANLLGRARELLNSNCLPMFLSDGHRDDFHFHIQKVIEAKGSYTSESRLLEANTGKLHWVHLATRQIFDSARELEFRTAITDISAIKEITQELVAAKLEAEAANQSKERFLATISHELRTPLNPIIGFSEIMCGSEELTIAESRNLSRKVLVAGELMLGLVEDILEYLDLQKRAIDLIPRSFDLQDLLDSVANRLSATRTDLTVRVRRLDEAENGCHHEVVTDRAKLRKCINILAENAFKFTREGSVSFRSGWIAEKTHSRIEVEDTGVGLDVSQVQTLFEAFSQADSSLTREFQGVGLGLAICRKLVTELGGTMGVKSELGRGSTFWLEIPNLPAPRGD